MFIYKRNTPYWYARIRTVSGTADISTKTTIKREAEKIGKQWQKEADLVKASKTGASEKIVPLLLNLGDQATKGLLDIPTLENEVAKIKRLLSGKGLCEWTLGLYLDQWIAKKDDIHGSTRKRYRHGITEIKELPESRKGLAEITRDDCLSIVNAIEKGGQGKRKGTTINLLLSPLRKGMQDAVYDGLIYENPLNTIKRADTNDSVTKGFFELEEIEAMLKVANHIWKGVICVGLYTGLRLKDCVTLKWDEVNFKSNQVIKKYCKQRFKKKVRKIKKFPIFGELEVYLKSTSLTLASGHKEFDGIEEHSEEWCDLFNSKFGSEFLFPKFASTFEGDKGGEYMSRYFIQQVRRKAGVPKKQILEDGTEAERSFHCFKHTTCFLMQRAGVSEEVRRAVLGHQSSAVHEIYMKCDPEAVARALKSSIPERLVAVN